MLPRCSLLFGSALLEDSSGHVTLHKYLCIKDTKQPGEQSPSTPMALSSYHLHQTFTQHHLSIRRSNGPQAPSGLDVERPNVAEKCNDHWSGLWLQPPK